MYKIKCISSLNKVFPTQDPGNDLTDFQLSAFQNETLSFQAAYYGDVAHPHPVSLKVSSDIKEHIHVRKIVLVPAMYPCATETDDDYLDTKPGLYPDVLRENPDNQVHVIPRQWASVWVDVNLSEDVKPGEYTINVSLIGDEGKEVASDQVTIYVYEGKLNKQKLIHTEWFHADCLADFYKIDVWSEEHWRVLENFIALYHKRGINTILTPIITPPLDIAVGGERTTAQLVDVTYDNGAYEFNFDKLTRWIKLCQKHNIEYFEMAHLYSQWGARFSPKIMATVEGKEKRIFGWDVPASDQSYQDFLAAFLPQLTDHLKEMEIDKNTYFHISDEPGEDDIEHYLQAKKQVEPYLKGFPIMDALSRLEFYESGAVDHPVPGTNHVEEFIDHGVPGLWTYYCNGQRVNLSNRFFSVSLARTRILGVQLYKFNLAGFLHWGFNFYNTRFSLEHINPYEMTDAGGNFPSGDSFLAYPGKGGEPEESTRLMAMSEAMQDVRALQTLEGYTSRDHVIALIDEGLKDPVTFTAFPKSSAYLLNLREKVNKQINQYTNK